MKEIRLSLIVTVYNEEKFIIKLLDSILNQSQLPDEIIIVDGGSKDKTLSKISEYKTLMQNKNLPSLKVLSKKGNRSVGRNEAVRNSKGKIILCTDSGNILDKKWVEEITKPFKDKTVDVVAGYYSGLSKNVFQKSLIPYVLVMKDRVNEDNFLPATRSMAFKKDVWKSIGGFDEKFSHNEDYVFAKNLEKNNIKIVFNKKAIVNWIPGKNLKQAFVMFFRFALGDSQANIYRDKVIYIFLRYAFALYLILLSAIMKSIYLNIFVASCFFIYLLWSILKNYKYVNNIKAIFFLPIIQFTSDFAVLKGTSIGVMQKFSINRIFEIISRNKGVSLIILIYILSMLSVISFGIPNDNHPFNYFMDEWHQSQSVRNLFKYGTPNIAGSANGSIFQFFLTGIYLIPFYIFRVIDPFAIKSSVTNLNLQFSFFEILRINTLMFGVMSISLISYISKKYLKLNSFLVAFLFTFNPLWMMLSNYFKYDIALTFWILLSFLFFIRYAYKPTTINWLFGGIFSGIALSTKLLTPLPLVGVYGLIFILFTPNFAKRIKILLLGLMVCALVYIFYGNPDIILGKGSLYDYLNSNIILASKMYNNYDFGYGVWPFFITKLYPATFGRLLYYSFIAAFLAGTIFLIKNLLNYSKSNFFSVLMRFINTKRANVVIVLCIILFLITLFPVGSQAISNRLIVLLPFMVLIVVSFLDYLYSKIKKGFLSNVFKFIFIILFCLQFIETYSWFSVKWSMDPRESASKWVVSAIHSGNVIGLENIPIYQSLPNIVEKEFYLNQYKVKSNFLYKYEIVNSKTKSLPDIVIITNDEVEEKYVKISEKKNLIKRIKEENYVRRAVFRPDFRYLKIFNGEFEYFMSSLIQAPNTISVYEKL